MYLKPLVEVNQSNPIQSNIYFEQTTLWTFTSKILQYISNNLVTCLLQLFDFSATTSCLKRPFLSIVTIFSFILRGILDRGVELGFTDTCDKRVQQGQESSRIRSGENWVAVQRGDYVSLTAYTPKEPQIWGKLGRKSRRGCFSLPYQYPVFHREQAGQLQIRNILITGFQMSADH